MRVGRRHEYTAMGRLSRRERQEMSYTAIGKAALPENKRRNGGFESEGGDVHGPQKNSIFPFSGSTGIACEACG